MIFSSRFSVWTLFAVILLMTAGLSDAKTALNQNAVRQVGDHQVSDHRIDDPLASLIRVNVTSQGYSFHRPWRKQSPARRTAIGVILKGPRVLITASLIANSRYIELEMPDTRVKSAATVYVVDYEANLALLEPSDPAFLSHTTPLELTEDAVTGDNLDIWQVRTNGAVVFSKGPVTAVEVTQYPYSNRFLSYRMNNSLQYRLGNATLPVVKDGKLAGMLMRHDPKDQTTDVIAAPVIAHFLEDAADGKYKGFPLIGFRIAFTEDPQLRRYAGIESLSGGVYVEHVSEKSPAETAGIQAGDIVTEIGDFSIDSRGNYPHPLYGRLSMTHLIRCEYHDGDNMKIRVFRDGAMKELTVMPQYKSAGAYTVPPYRIDAAPRYYILGGLIFHELSKSYLNEYNRRQSRVPQHLLYYAGNQNNMAYGERKKIVFLSAVLPTSYTIGYEDLSDLVLLAVNEQPVSTLEDIPAALKNPVKGFHKIEFEQRPGTIYLDPAELPVIDELIKKRYYLPALKNLN